jgi:acetyl esterase/lipase
MSEKTSDPLLKFYADTSDCTVISVGYRLAPEHPFPAGVEDCFDVADYLVKNGPKLYGGPLRFIGGEVGEDFLISLHSTP